MYTSGVAYAGAAVHAGPLVYIGAVVYTVAVVHTVAVTLALRTQDAGSDPGPRTSSMANSVSRWLKATSEVCRASDHGRRFTDVSRFTPVQQPGLPEASAFSARRWQPRAFVLSDRGRAGGLGRPVATSGYRRHSRRPDFPRRAVARGAPWRLGALPQRRPRRPRRLRSPRAAEGGRGARGHHGRR